MSVVLVAACAGLVFACLMYLVGGNGRGWWP